jgi:hypothetical protein
MIQTCGVTYAARGEEHCLKEDEGNWLPTIIRISVPEIGFVDDWKVGMNVEEIFADKFV